MPERTKRILLYGVAAPFFFLFSLIVGAYLTFPYEHVREFVIQEAARGGTQLDMESLEPSWLTGVEVEGLRVSSVPEGDEAPTELVIPHAEARISLLSLVAGTTEVSFDADFEGGGSVEGTYAQSEDSTHLDAQIERLDLAQVGPLRSAIGLPITGLLQGDIDLTVGAEAVDTEGSANLTIQNLSVADGETPLAIEGLGPGLTLERMNLGSLAFRMETERGTGSIERLHTDGEHAEIWGTGSIRLARELPRSSMDMLFRIHFKEPYRTSTPRMEGLFALLDVNPQVRPARVSEGIFQWRVTGSFGGRVRMIPSGRAPMPEAD